MRWIELEGISRDNKTMHQCPETILIHLDELIRLVHCYHLKHFIDHFENEECLITQKEYNVKQYNETGVLLTKFIVKCKPNRRNPSIRQIEGMIAKPVLKYPKGK